MAYLGQSHGPDPKDMMDAQERYDALLRLKNQVAPRPLEGETLYGYKRKMAERLQSMAPNCQDFKITEAHGSAFDTLEKQIYNDAMKEALNPTQIPEGELRQVTHRDEAGRPSYTFHGRPSTWMSQFSSGKKRLVGIRTETDHGYAPPNVAAIAGLRY